MNAKQIVFSVFGIAIKIVVAVILVMLIYKYAVTGYDYGYRLFGEEPISSGEGRTIQVTIPEGASAKEIGEILENKGLIRDAKLFMIQEKVSEYKDGIQPGTYELNTAMTAEEMIATMSAVEEATSEEESVDLDELMEDDSEEVLGMEEEPEVEE